MTSYDQSDTIQDVTNCFNSGTVYDDGWRVEKIVSVLDKVVSSLTFLFLNLPLF